MRLIEHFDKGAEVDPRRIAAVDAATSRTYRELQLASHRFANAVAAMGLAPGTRVAILSENSVSAFECIVGILRAACVWVPVSINQSREATAAMLHKNAVTLLLYSRKHRVAAYELVAQVDSLRKAICIDAPDAYSPGLPSLLAASSASEVHVNQSNDDVVTLFSSGGTTGAPKGVMMTNLCWESIVAGFMSRYRVEQPVHLVAAPITHAAGGAAIAMSSLAATNVLLDGFEPVKIMSNIQHHRVTHLFLPPAAIQLMLKHPDIRRYDYSSLRFFIYGSAPMSSDVIKQAIGVFGPVLATAFGQTETGPDVTFFSPRDVMLAFETGSDERLRSCGRATSFVRVAIMNDEGRLLPPKTVGELVVRGNQIMKGYHADPDETARATQFGWHHTGDLGYMDAEGYFYIVDRKRDVIKSGGFNVFPSEIEGVLRQHPAVRDCAVVGQPDEDWGEVPVAVIEPNELAKVDVGDIQALCAHKLARLQIPRRFEVWAELPRGQAGKVSRRQCRERLLAAS